MSNTTPGLTTQFWRLEEFRANFATAHASGTCNLLAPSTGLHDLAVDGSPLAGMNMLGLSLPAVAVGSAAIDLEAYARCGDLVGIYAPTTEHPFRSQAYWRLASHDTSAGEQPALAAIEVVASKQTDLLDSQPELSAASSLPCSSAWRLTDVDRGAFDEIDLSRKPVFSRANGIACFLFRLPGSAISYAEMVFPLDFETTQLELTDQGGCVRIAHRLFAHRLEKGVILRARVLGLFVARDGDLQRAAAHYGQFAASDPPLTT